MTHSPDDPIEEPEVSPDDPGAVPSKARTGGSVGLLIVVACVAMVTLLLLVTVAGRTVRAPPLVLTVLTVGLPYLYGAVLAVLFGVWAAVPDRRLPPILGAAVLLIGAALWGVSLPAFPEEAAGEPLRLMSWNVRRLWGGAGDGGDPVQCVIKAIETEAPDVLSLQEVSRRDVDVLSKALDLRCVHSDYLGTQDPSLGGLAACSRGENWRLHSGQPAVFEASSQWRYVFAEFAHNDIVINLMAVHLHPYSISHRMSDDPAEVASAQVDQSAELLRRVGRFKDPTLVAGDFNSSRDQALHTALRAPLQDTFERGGQGFGPTVHLLGWLPLRIDYVYATDAFAVQESHVPAVDCSDHRPVVSDVVLKSSN